LSVFRRTVLLVSEHSIEVRRSKRRTRTVSAYREGDTLIVLLPARMTKKEEAHWVAEMQQRLQRSEKRRGALAGASDEVLLERSQELNQRYFKGDATPASVRWVPPMRTRWASCTTIDRTIRVSSHLRKVPGWVLDYVLVHELAHLIVPGHGPDFWKLVRRYQKTERAMGYLEGLASAAGWGITEED